MKILIVVEKTRTGYSAYSPDLPGCVATGADRRAVERAMRKAIALHLEGLEAEGLKAPKPRSWSTWVEIPS